MAKKKKKSNKTRNLLLIVGAFSLGIFTVTIFAKTWGFLMQNADMVLIVTGSILAVLVLIGILSPKKVKRSLFGSAGRFKA